MKIFKKSLKYIYFLPKCTEYHEKVEKLAGLGSVKCTKTRPRGKTKTKYFEDILSKPYILTAFSMLKKTLNLL